MSDDSPPSDPNSDNDHFDSEKASSRKHSSPGGWKAPSIEELHELIPQYEITDILGLGAMGAVYKARQIKLNREVAIKLLPADFADGSDDTFAKRFEQEAQAMASLNHPAIVSVHDFGETRDGQLYFVMEYVDGLDIRQYIKEYGGFLPQEHALSIAAHVLDALEYAHRNGIIHRDIKPANILLNREGLVKIADFGLAKHFTEDRESLTQSNVRMGSPAFMAPEAMKFDRQPDHRADLYAVGVMLYQMLTGDLPQGQFKMPSKLQPALDPRLDEIIDRAMQSNPEDRYDSASQIRSDLDSILSTPITQAEGDEPVADALASEAASPVLLTEDDLATTHQPASSEPPATKSKTPLLIGGALTALLVVGGVIAMVGGGKGDPAPEVAQVDEQPAPTSPGQEFTTSALEDDSSIEPAAPTQPAAPEKVEVEFAPESPTESNSSQEVAKNVSPPQEENSNKDTPSQAAEIPEPEPAVVEAEPESQPEADNDAEAESENTYAAVPNLFPRLNRYLDARRVQVGGLASNYLRALEGKLNASADAGELKLVQAYQAERKRVVEFQNTLKEKPESPISALSSTATLTDLPEASPEELVHLRQTWTQERRRIESTLETQLQQSLKYIERELTKARDYKNAETVLALRESLLAPNPITANKIASVETPEPPPPSSEKPSSEEDTELTNPKLPIQGRLRTVGAFKNSAPLDLSKADPYNDFVELIYNRKGFVARRANGQIVSNFMIRPKPPTSAARLVQGGSKIFDGLFGIIDSSGKLTLHRAAEKVIPSLPSSDKPIRSVSLNEKVGLTVYEDGSLSWWGIGYEADADGKIDWKSPPQEATTNVTEAIVAYGNWAAVLKKDGTVIAWNPEREIRLPTEIRKNVKIISSQGSQLIAATDEGTLLSIDLRDGFDINKTVTEIHGGGTTVDALGQRVPRLICRTSDGAWHLHDLDNVSETQIAAIESFHDLEPNQFMFDIDQDKIDVALWIESAEDPDKPILTDTENPFGWKPIPEDPFPLTRPKRSTVPCQVVAWRLDGQPVDAAKFRQAFGGLPSEMGEVVDLSGDSQYFHSENRESIKTVISGLKSDGSVVTLRPFDAQFIPTDLEEIVAIEGTGQWTAALTANGRARVWAASKVTMDTTKESLAPHREWKDLVNVVAAENAAAALTRSGDLLFCGQLVEKGFAPPAAFRSRLVQLSTPMMRSSTLSLVRQTASPDVLEVYRSDTMNEIETQPGGRVFFASSHVFTAVEDGRLDFGSFSGGDPTAVNRMRRRDFADIRAVEKAITTPRPNDWAAVAVARSGDSKWHFWGDLKQEGKIDFDHCDKRANGCWKVKILPPYVIGLKTVANLTPDDWTGAQRAVTKSESKPLDVTFPLPVPQRPKLAGRLEVHRLDALPIGTNDNDNPLSKLPEDLGSRVVSIDIGWHIQGEADRNAMAIALLNDGTVRVWTSQNNGTASASAIAANPTLGLSDVVQVSAGEINVMCLKSDGTVWTAGYRMGGFDPFEAKQFDTGGEKAVMVNVLANHAFVLTESGRVLYATLDGGILTPTSLPPSVFVIGSGGGFALGADGIWRGWSGGELNGRVSAQAPSHGMLGKPFATLNDVRWVDRDGILRSLHKDGRAWIQDNSPKAINSIGTQLFRAVETAPGEWVLLSPPGEHGGKRAELLEAIQGLSGIAASRVYLFGIRPLGR